MLILLRLAEDVITFQALPAQRRRDIQQTLTQNMENIFSFMMAILQLNVEDYRRLVSAVSTFYFVVISSGFIMTILFIHVNFNSEVPVFFFLPICVLFCF